MKIEKLFHEFRSEIDAAAKAKADVVYLTEFRKSKKAMLIQEAENNGIKTGQERESYAYAHPEYMELLKGLKVAVEANEGYQWRMRLAQDRIKIYQTHEANKRAEFKGYGN